MDDRTFYKTTVTFTVLSQEPIPDDVGVRWIGQECDEGSYVGSTMTIETQERNAVEIIEDLREVEGDPAVFQLDANGEPISREQ